MRRGGAARVTAHDANALWRRDARLNPRYWILPAAAGMADLGPPEMRRRLSPPRGVQFLQDAMHVVLHRRQLDAQAPGDFLV